MASRTLSVVISGDAKGAQDAFKQVESASLSAEDKLRHLADSAKAWGDNAVDLGKKFALNITLPIAALAAVGFRELEASGKVAAQTEAVIRSTGGAANVTAKQVDALGASLLRKSGMDDEAIKSGANLLLTFTNIRNEVGKGNDIFTQATKLSLDLSVAFGKDMTQSAVLVGKALQDPIAGVTALRRVGVDLTDAQREQIQKFVDLGDTMSAQKVILAELRTEVGGSAKAYGETLAGQVSRAREELKNASAAMLVIAAPAIEALSRGVMNLATWMTNLDGPTKTVVVSIAGVAAAIGPVLIIAGKMAQGFAAIASMSAALATGLESATIKVLYMIDALKAMSAAQLLSLGALGIVLGGLAALVVALSMGRSRYDEISDAAKKWADMQARNAAAIGDNARALETLQQKQNILKTSITDVLGAMEQERQVYLSGQETIDQRNTHLQALSYELERLKARHDDLAPSIENLKQKIHEAQIAEEARRESLVGVSTGTQTLTTATDDAYTAIQNLQSLILAQSGSELGYEQALLNSTKAQEALNEAVKEHGPFSREAYEATLNLKQSQLQAAQAALALDDAHTNLNRTVRQTPEAIDAEIKKLQESKANHHEVAGAIDEQIWKLGELKGQIDSVPPDKRTDFYANTENATAKVEAYLRLLAQTNAISSAFVAAGGSGQGEFVVGAEGAIVSQPTIALIGEAGPEAVVPLNRMPGASSLPGGGGGDLQIVVMLDSATIAKAVERDFNRRGRGGPILVSGVVA